MKTAFASSNKDNAPPQSSSPSPFSSSRAVSLPAPRLQPTTPQKRVCKSWTPSSSPHRALRTSRSIRSSSPPRATTNNRGGRHLMYSPHFTTPLLSHCPQISTPPPSGCAAGFCAKVSRSILVSVVFAKRISATGPLSIVYQALTVSLSSSD